MRTGLVIEKNLFADKAEVAAALTLPLDIEIILRAIAEQDGLRWSLALLALIAHAVLVACVLKHSPHDAAKANAKGAETSTVQGLMSAAHGASHCGILTPITLR